MEQNKIIADKYMNWLSNNYDAQVAKLKAYCFNKGQSWDADIFCNTYLKIYDKIVKHGIRDDSNDGFDNYTFKSFKINVMREKQYARNIHRSDDEPSQKQYECYLNTLLSEKEKILSDLKKDFSALYLMQIAESNFDAESFYLFKLKTLGNMTYKELSEYTGMKGIRDKVVEVKNYLITHVSKDEIDKAFNLFQRNYL